MKNLLKQRKASGFTIIEVMIVLAIAGLILVIVFLAVPQLQRNQRDNARQGVTNRVKAEMETYAGNNQGKLPFDTTACSGTDVGKWCDFYNRYINNKVDVNDPSGGAALVTLTPTTSCATASGFYMCDYAAGVALPEAKPGFAIVRGAKCSGEGVTNSGSIGANTRNYALLVTLDRSSAGSASRYCVDNG